MNTQVAENPNRFYVYALYDGYVPFYVGKGTRDRIKKHIKITRDGSNLPVHNKIRKMNYKHQERILADGLTDSDALELEELTIITVGRRDLKTGSLLNLTNGGEGPSPSKETRKRQSIAGTGRKATSEACANQSKALKGRTHTDQARRLLSKSLMGHSVSEKTRAKISATKKENWNNGIRVIYQIVTCPHCNKTGGASAMGRWHFNNCRFKKGN